MEKGDTIPLHIHFRLMVMDNATRCSTGTNNNATRCSTGTNTSDTYRIAGAGSKKVKETAPLKGRFFVARFFCMIYRT